MVFSGNIKDDLQNSLLGHNMSYSASPIYFHGEYFISDHVLQPILVLDVVPCLLFIFGPYCSLLVVVIFFECYCFSYSASFSSCLMLKFHCLVLSKIQHLANVFVPDIGGES